MNRLDLNSNWRILERPLGWHREYAMQVKEEKDGWLTSDLPCDVRMPLLAADRIKEPLVADYWEESTWVEERSWWFVKTFDSSEVCLDDDIIELMLDGLDSRGDIFVNGRFLGTHRNVHYPFKYDIKPLIQGGENEIMIRLTSGLETVTEADVGELNYAVCMEKNNNRPERGDERRSFVRRAQYNVGWDWGPRVISIGIIGGVSLSGYAGVAIREVNVETVSIGETARLKAMVNIENVDVIRSSVGRLTIEITNEEGYQQIIHKDNILLTSGYNYLDLEWDVQDAKLWWPNGYGEQPMYQITVSVKSAEGCDTSPTFSYGIRKIVLDTDAINDKERKFTVVVNDVPVFCKGGNWIPSDFIIARVPDSKYQTLIEEAVAANFNMLRIWGGGYYEREWFYDLCNRHGILVWQDFMLACSTYPDHQAWFKAEMRCEMDYQTKRLRNHACIALWNGTNENHWIFNPEENPNWGINITYEYTYGLSVANQLAKEIVRSNCSNIPYWPSSPYGGNRPNDSELGNMHYWPQMMMNPDMAKRIEVLDYDKIPSKFVSEYGFVGPCGVETIKQYLGTDVIDRKSAAWESHNNTFEKKTVNAAIEKNYRIADAFDLSLEDYILYGSMVQGLMYGYSLESMRFKEHCSGGIFWMYNDAWGEIGWTIVDYYLRRKNSFYAVKRALAHQRFALREIDGKVVLKGFNDGPTDLVAKGEIGYVSFDGKIRETKEVTLQVSARSHAQILICDLPDYDYTKGAFVLFVDDENLDNIILHKYDTGRLDFASDVKVVKREVVGEDQILTVESAGFAHGVHIEGEYRCSDAYFDLLPGCSKTFVVEGAKDATLKVRTVK